MIFRKYSIYPITLSLEYKKKRRIKTYIDQHVSRLSDKELVQEPQEHPNSSARNIRTSCYNHTFSKRKLAAPGENALFLSNSANKFASMDYSIIW